MSGRGQFICAWFVVLGSHTVVFIQRFVSSVFTEHLDTLALNALPYIFLFLHTQSSASTNIILFSCFCDKFQNLLCGCWGRSSDLMFPWCSGWFVSDFQVFGGGRRQNQNSHLKPFPQKRLISVQTVIKNICKSVRLRFNWSWIKVGEKWHHCKSQEQVLVSITVYLTDLRRRLKLQNVILLFYFFLSS